MTPLLEVCVDSIEGLLTAQRFGADRIELCSALSEGGLTPSYGTISRAVSLAKVPIHVLVRPRGGNFVFSEDEQQVMAMDIQFLRDSGVQGAVIGGLTAAAEVDLELTRQLIQSAGTLNLTFHRAFDEVSDPFKALDQLADLGISRVLTSGGRATGLEGRERLRLLLEHAQDRLTILGCGSLRPENVGTVLDTAPLSELHFAARCTLADGSIGTNGEMIQQMRLALADR